jgi:hypothetical protein
MYVDWDVLARYPRMMTKIILTYIYKLKLHFQSYSRFYDCEVLGALLCIILIQLLTSSIEKYTVQISRSSFYTRIFHQNSDSWEQWDYCWQIHLLAKLVLPATSLSNHVSTHCLPIILHIIITISFCRELCVVWERVNTRFKIIAIIWECTRASYSWQL